jgi:hypothetical protein
MEITVTRRIVVEEKTCPSCGKRFVGPKVKKFCGRLCLNKASYQKHAEARRAHRRAVYHEQKGQQAERP